ncbi:hypothetical protein BC834DRAFT_388981 [Gloeopeniophorella convolvens]|nr:hypothetical protein BC834DRAFT_388981 [Gloeopeniophorella convolvens]
MLPQREYQFGLLASREPLRTCADRYKTPDSKRVNAFYTYSNEKLGSSGRQDASPPQQGEPGTFYSNRTPGPGEAPRGRVGACNHLQMVSAESLQKRCCFQSRGQKLVHKDGAPCGRNLKRQPGVCGAERHCAHLRVLVDTAERRGTSASCICNSGSCASASTSAQRPAFFPRAPRMPSCRVRAGMPNVSILPLPPPRC